MSRLMEVHDNLSAAYSAQMEIPPQEFLRPFLLAGLTQLVISAATGAWFMGEHKDIESATRQAFRNLSGMFAAESLPRLLKKWLRAADPIH